MIIILLLSLGMTVIANRSWQNDGLVYQRITYHNPDLFKGYLGQAEYLARQGLIKEAVGMYEKSIALAAINSKAEPMMRLADLMASNGQKAEAIQLYKNAISLSSSKLKVEILMHLGLLLGESGDYAYSLEVFNQVTQIEPQNSAAWNGVGNNLWMLGRLDDAVHAYRKAVNANPGNWQACNNLWKLLSQSENPEEAALYADCAAVRR
jgi:protein O-GlcNAc transferase